MHKSNRLTKFFLISQRYEIIEQVILCHVVFTSLGLWGYCFLLLLGERKASMVWWPNLLTVKRQAFWV